MTSFLRSIGPASVVAATLAIAATSAATELGDSRDVASPARMVDPAVPTPEAPAVAGDRDLTPPATPQSADPAGARHPDPGSDVNVEREDIAKPEFDPGVAAEEKPGVEAELAAKPVKDAKEVAAASAHERGFFDVMNDLYTNARVKMSLALDSRTPAMEIDVDTTDGRVTLFGIVPTAEAKFAAGADAASISGVEGVDNTLQVVAEERQADVLAHDAEVQEVLKKSLEPYPAMQGIGIDVKNCVARLTGTVPAGKERDEAMLAVRKTPGVCQVKDELRFTAT